MVAACASARPIYDIGQTVVIAESALRSGGAMEGTDATFLRAGEIIEEPGAARSNRSTDLKSALR